MRLDLACSGDQTTRLNRSPSCHFQWPSLHILRMTGCALQLVHCEGMRMQAVSLQMRRAPLGPPDTEVIETCQDDTSSSSSDSDDESCLDGVVETMPTTPWRRQFSTLMYEKLRHPRQSTINKGTRRSSMSCHCLGTHFCVADS